MLKLFANFVIFKVYLQLFDSFFDHFCVFKAREKSVILLKMGSKNGVKKESKNDQK